ncbi:hypothetical protein G7Y89_g11471 [Cudoniella acicularis]|uniref:ABC transporter domain-containing protein n=1 Tax=Cudoniella acicularis TaxID=354080 RepID=A0A8H4W0L9_9HELO|nr:hypothetical protein G7Y89_g11471 [Cudoniella acicularis]
MDTKVGNAFVQGISGGERKRASIAEIMVGQSPLQCWDNSTRGLDSANAFEFLIALRNSTRICNSSALVTLYQASQGMYEMFDKVILLYEGHQIFFGHVKEAKEYFVKIGFVCPERSTTGDFLTSITNPTARIAQLGSKAWSLRSPQDFSDIWRLSSERKRLLQEIKDYESNFLIQSSQLESFRAIRRSQRSLHTRQGSPYTVSFAKQIHLCFVRGLQRLGNNLETPVSAIGGNTILSIILGSMFYNMPETTDSFFGRSVLLFFTILLNAFLGAFEGVGLWETRPVVEKHYHLALYHPTVESISSMICDLPNKILLTFGFNIPFYFLANLRKTPSAFFVFCLFAFSSLVAGAVFISALVIYTGFVIPVPNMHPWFQWLRYIDPIAYAFESLMINEFEGRQFQCAMFVPSGPNYANLAPWEHMCAAVGAVPGSSMGHVALEAGVSDAESQKFHVKTLPQTTENEKLAPASSEKRLHSTPFLWNNLTYNIKTHQGPRRILDGIQGWVKQGSLTAVMGCSGAGKTTLLNVLANRSSLGVVGGEIVKGSQDEGKHSFARKVGYAQQADIHLSTSTVREALEFSALLRQSEKYSSEERLSYVSEVVKLLDMDDFVDAVIGVPGEGLNVEQRKKVTIGVELAVRPELLLFLDEPTSGLDSNTAWAICRLLQRLSEGGQAILCTIHQPSGDLFQMFNNLLLLSEDGKQIYFGNIGPKCQAVINYFENGGARKCREDENPAEWLLEVTKSSSTENTPDWPDKWKMSQEKKEIDQELKEMNKVFRGHQPSQNLDSIGRKEFARSFLTQLSVLTRRNLVRDWRTPSYLYSKLILTIAAGLLNGFSFWHSENNLQGVQNQIFSFFLLLTLFSNLVQLIMPQYIENRDLYEVRERPSKMYSWPAFVLSNTLAELPWQTILAVFLYVVWYYPIGMSKNMTPDDVNERSALVFLFIWSFMIFTSTFSQFVVTPLPTAALGVNIASLLYSLSLIFCGVLVSPSKLPRFWIWMLRITPLTYFVGGAVSTGIGHSTVVCSVNELVHFDAPGGIDCGSYLAAYVSYAGGRSLIQRRPKTVSFAQYPTQMQYWTPSAFITRIDGETLE